MCRLLIVVLAVLLSGLVPNGIAAQVATPSGNRAGRHCGPLPRAGTPSVSDAATPAIVATPASLTPGDEAPLPQRTPPPGAPASSEALARIWTVEEQLAACFAAGDYLGFTSLLSGNALREELGVAVPGEPAVFTVRYALLREELESVTDAQTHADGRVSVEVVFAYADQRMRARDLFVEVDGQLFLDEIVELPLEAAPEATPPASLDDATLAALTIVGFAPGYEPAQPELLSTASNSVAMQPGDASTVVLGTIDFESCGPIGYPCFSPVPVQARWSVTPADGADIDAETGLLTIDPSVPSGSVFTVRADVESGRHVVDTEAHVYTLEDNPLIGYWREEAQIACDTGEESTPAELIEELVFLPDGTFNVTWHPFESYVDYWGTYEFDLAQGTLELVVSDGNHVPPDVDGDGRFTLAETGQLTLTEIWLGAPWTFPDEGTPLASGSTAICGHRFGG